MWNPFAHYLIQIKFGLILSADRPKVYPSYLIGVNDILFHNAKWTAISIWPYPQNCWEISRVIRSVEVNLIHIIKHKITHDWHNLIWEKWNANLKELYNGWILSFIKFEWVRSNWKLIEKWLPSQKRMKPNSNGQTSETNIMEPLPVILLRIFVCKMKSINTFFFTSNHC